MCEDCGCGQGGEVTIHGAKPNERPEVLGRPSPKLSPAPTHSHSHSHSDSDSHSHLHSHPHTHAHAHENDHTHHSAAPGNDAASDAKESSRVIAVQRSLVERNERLAERNRGFFQAKRLLVLNVLSGPGAGKTTLLQKTAERLRGRLRVGVIVGDLATENDADRLRTAEIPVVQITTGTVCHLEADMVAAAMQRLDLDALDVLIIENVGNLVCPASFDLGESLRVVLLSVTEGEDKPLKYPPLFHSADVALITKADLAEATGFDREAALSNLHRVSHHACVLEVSARTGAGMDAWCELLVRERARAQGKRPE